MQAPLLEYLGRFHPAATHFPVALLLVAVIAEIIDWWHPSSFFHHVGAFNLHVGALSAVGTAVLGWILAANSHDLTPDLKPLLPWHRWLGVGVAVWSLVALVFWHLNRRKPSKQHILTYRVILFAAAIAVGVVGHIGGLLVNGLDYFTWGK